MKNDFLVTIMKRTIQNRNVTLCVFLRYSLAIYPPYLRSLWRRGVDGQMGAGNLSGHLRGVVHWWAGGGRVKCREIIL
jgi:hypothetical protein